MHIHPSVIEAVKARVGTRIKQKWLVESLLGVGGMGAVYAATHRNGNRVALKVLHTQLSIDGDIRARFGREGYVANSVNHPGVVRSRGLLAPLVWRVRRNHAAVNPRPGR